jgi:hypothetical protein
MRLHHAVVAMIDVMAHGLDDVVQRIVFPVGDRAGSEESQAMRPVRS